MNIFFFSVDPEECAKSLCDVHLRKMIVEYAQLLSTAHHVFNSDYKGWVYKKTYVNHPCAVWVRVSDANYLWLHSLLVECLQEYRHRFLYRHKTKSILHFLDTNPVPVGDFSVPPNCTPYKWMEDTSLAYKAYYNSKLEEWTQRHKPISVKYTNRDKPAWLRSV